MRKGDVPAKLGRAVWVQDADGTERFSHIAITPATDEELAEIKAFTAEKLSGLQFVPGQVSQGTQRAHYASQMITIVEERMEREPLNMELWAAHASLLRDMGQTRHAAALYPTDPKLHDAIEALDRPDDAYCACPHPSRVINGVEMRGDKYRVKSVFYPEQGGDTKLYECTQCHTRNVSNIPPSDL